MSPPPVPKDDDESVFDEYEDDNENKRVVPDVEDTVDVTLHMIGSSMLKWL